VSARASSRVVTVWLLGRCVDRRYW